MNCLLPLLLLTVGTTTHGQVQFLVIGNWGTDEAVIDSQSDQAQVASVMEAWLNDNSCQGIISTGDNFYPNGMESPDDPRFEAFWKDVYNTPNLASQPWIVSVGNRDHNLNDTRALYQVDKSTTEPMWQFPALYYERYFTDGTTTVQVVVLDTEIIIHDHFGQDPNTRAAQLAWFSSVLENPQNPPQWTIVVGHHPLRSCGTYGPREDPLIPHIEQTMIDNDVDFYLSGHDQNMQHISRTVDPIFDQIVNGAGGRGNYPFNDAACQQLAEDGYTSNYFASQYGFTTVSASPTGLRMTHYDDQGQMLYEYTRS